MAANTSILVEEASLLVLCNCDLKKATKVQQNKLTERWTPQIREFFNSPHLYDSKVLDIEETCKKEHNRKNKHEYV